MSLIEIKSAFSPFKIGVINLHLMYIPYIKTYLCNVIFLSRILYWLACKKILKIVAPSHLLWSHVECIILWNMKLSQLHIMVWKNQSLKNPAGCIQKIDYIHQKINQKFLVVIMHDPSKKICFALEVKSNT